MPETTNIIEVPGPEYSWDTYVVSWDTETLNIWDKVFDSDFTLEVSSSLLFVEDFRTLNLVRKFEEFFATDEAYKFNFDLNKYYSLNFSENYIDLINFIRHISESLGFSEDKYHALGREFDEFLGIEEDRTFKAYKEIGEALELVHDFSRVVEYILDLPEPLNFEYSLTKNFTKDNLVDLVLSDLLVKKANSSYSDLIIYNQSLTLDKFIDLVNSSSPPGYTEYKKFLPGDYKYRYAKVKAVLSTISDDTPILDNVKVTIDVPDIHNKGTTIISDANLGAEVTYPRAYTVDLPDVVLSFKGGIGGVATPEITNESLTGFTVKLINSSGVYITGSVTWAADGY